jgi:hypothetical protein
MTDINLAQRALEGKLTVEEVNHATKEKLEDNKYFGCVVLYWTSMRCGIEVIEAILNKKVNIDVQTGYVSLLVVHIIKL